MSLARSTPDDADQVAKTFVGGLQPSILRNLTPHSRAVLEIHIASLIRREREKTQREKVDG